MEKTLLKDLLLVGQSNMGEMRGLGLIRDGRAYRRKDDGYIVPSAGPESIFVTKEGCALGVCILDFLRGTSSYLSFDRVGQDDPIQNGEVTGHRRDALRTGRFCDFYQNGSEPLGCPG